MALSIRARRTSLRVRRLAPLLQPAVMLIADYPTATVRPERGDGGIAASVPVTLPPAMAATRPGERVALYRYPLTGWTVVGVYRRERAV
jgi:hypothetical protein